MRLSHVTIVVAAMTLAAAAVAQETTVEELRAKYPPNVEALDPGFHWAPEFQREVVTPERDRVPIRTDWPDVFGLQRSPVTFGVPFADGALASAENARLLTADGTPMPADLSATATWWREDGPVRWMLVSATLERDEQYFIEYGTHVEAFEAEGMTVTETDNAIVIDTGPVQATVSKTRATILDEVTVDGETIVTAEAAAANLPTVVGGDGTEYPASAHGLQVSFIRRGPMETVIRREGWYTSDSGERFCQFITYTWFFAGSASIRHDHTLVVGFDATKHTIRDIRLAVPVGGQAQQAAFSLDSESARKLEVVGGVRSRLVQSAEDHFELTGPGRDTVEGEKSGGWAGAVTADAAGAFVCIRDFAEQYPMELEVTQDAVVAHLWPLHDAPVLDLTPSAVMGDEYPGDRVFWRDFYRGGLDAWTQGYGVAKTHNLQFSFSASRDEESGAYEATLAFDTPVLAFADPEYACDTWAFGRVHPEDRDELPEIEALIDAILHRKHWLRDRLGNYGWVNFGDVNYSLANPTDPEEIDYIHWRHWAQMFYGGPNIYPLLFMRSGRRDAWDFHRVNPRHIMDFDICHLDSDESHGFRFEKRRGGRYGGNGGICHYAANIYTLGCDCHTRFMLWDWYLNGNPRAWEVFEEFVTQYAARRHLYHNTVYRHRMTGGALRLFSEAYEATWNPEYLSCAHQFADILYGAQAELGFTRYDDVYMNEGKIKYYQLTGDERVRELFLNDMRVLSRRRDCDVFADCRATTLWGLAHAYWLTGDRSFLPYAVWQLDVALGRVPTSGEPHEIGAVGWTFEHAYEATLGNQLPVFAQLLAEVDELPQPAGPTTIGNGPIYLDQPQDHELAATLQVAMYRDVPGLGAAPFSNWQDWAQTLPEEDRPALEVIGPDGEQVARMELLGAREQGPWAFAGPEDSRETLRLRLPADGRTGTYAIVPQSPYVPLHLKVIDTNAPHVLLDTRNCWSFAATHYFRVPAGTGEFAIEVKALALRSDIAVTVRNAAGEVVAERTWEVGSECRHDPERIELDAGTPQQDEAWSLTYLAPMATFLTFEGVPPGVASSAEELFVPARVQPHPEMDRLSAEAPVHAQSPLPGGGQALGIPEEIGITMASPDGTPLLNETEGTIEMWVRDLRRPTDLHNRSLVRCGDLHLYRRIQIGTYLYMGPGHQTGLVPPAGRWAHLAATWRPSERDPGKTEVALYLDGVRVETSYNRHIAPEEGWAGPELSIPAGGAGLFVDELRVSDVARYAESFDCPAAAFEPDKHTLILSHFDGEGTALVRGQEVAWEVR
ncbi:MAG: hypothetical protein U9R79_18650 [Armatimonadota bacterium]|nr:hypothetical protein [Armatimonadota bacterium]